jgi:hypothetical protein
MWCGGKKGQVAKRAPRSCQVLGHIGTAWWFADLARLRWRDWGEAVSHAQGLLLDSEDHVQAHVHAALFGSAECDGVRYYRQMRLSGRRGPAILVRISPC